jgi:hypothetical protein
VAVGHDEVEGVVQQVGALQLDVGLGQRLVLVDEGEVQLPAGQPRDQPLAVVVEHGQGDVGVALVEAGDGPGDQGLDGGGEAGQPQPTPPQAGELLCESVDLRAGELLRVCRPSGRIGMVSWTPDGDLGQLLGAIGRHLPAPAGLAALAPDRAGALRAELLELAGRFDVSEDDTLVLRLDYLEAVVRKPVWR